MTTILTIIPYHFYPPMNGGSLRCFYVLREMAREHAVYLFTVQPETDFHGSNDPVFPKNVTIISLCDAKPYHSVFNILPAKIANAINYRILKKTWFGSTNSYFLDAYPLLLKALNELNPTIVYYENLEAVNLFSSLVKQYLPKAKQIYDAHNIDSELWKQLSIAQNNPEFEKYSDNAFKAEKKLFKIVDGVFCCSEKDQEKLMQINGQQLNSWIIPNGVDCLTKIFDKNPEKYRSQEILFCGSLEYYPNEEGLLWFYNEVFPLIKKSLPAVILTLVGTVTIKENYQLMLSDSSVHFEGRVADVKPFYYRASVCIAPLHSGSGTRLKILEAMSFGNPVVATTIGAEGLKYNQNEQILIADTPEMFAYQILRLLQNKELFDHTRFEAKKLVATFYDWQTIGTGINDALEKITGGDNVN